MSEEHKPVVNAASPDVPAEPTAVAAGEAPSVRARPYAGPLALAASLLALATLVGGYFVWHEVQRQAAWQQQVQARIEARGQSLDQRLDTFKDRLDNDLAAGERARRELEAAQRDLARGQAGLEDALGVLRAQVSRQHTDWTLAEVQYLLQIANLRVQLERDVPTAVAALGAADQRLQTLADPAFTPVREAITRELAGLRAVALPDVAGIALTLDTLAAEVRKLPLKNTHLRQPAAAPAAAPATAAGWWERAQQMLGNVGDALRSLVVVRRNDVPVGPLLAPDQQFFLYENLRLQLATARLAALRGQPEIYRGSLSSAARWLANHFDAQVPAVEAARVELERLAALDIRPALPDVSVSLRLLREQMQKSQPAMPSAPAAGTDADGRGSGDAQ